MTTILGLLSVLAMFVCVYTAPTDNPDHMEVMGKITVTLCGDNLPADKLLAVKACDAVLSPMFKMSFGACLLQGMNIKVATKPFPCYTVQANNDGLMECLTKRREMAVKMGIDVNAMRAKMIGPYAECMKPLV